MTPDVRDDVWDDPRVAETYAEIVAAGSVYAALARGLAQSVALSPGDRALDLAAGTGIVSRALLAQVGREGYVVALDRAPAMLDVARREAPVAAFAAVVADPARLPFADGGFDAATCSAAIWHFPALGAALCEVHRVLRRGGRFAFNAPAGQMAEEPAPAPAPFLLALAEEGRSRFGAEPAPSGPVLSRSRVLDLVREAGFTIASAEARDLEPTQEELAALAELPPFAARLFPDQPSRARAACVAAARSRVEGAERATIRFLEFVCEKP